MSNHNDVCHGDQDDIRKCVLIFLAVRAKKRGHAENRIWTHSIATAKSVLGKVIDFSAIANNISQYKHQALKRTNQQPPQPTPR